MQGALGKRYELQACEAVCGAMGTNWIAEASLVARTNPLVTLTAPADLTVQVLPRVHLGCGYGRRRLD